MKNVLKILLASLLFLFTLTLHSPFALAAEVMTSNLTLGSQGAQVLTLQQLLNSDPRTQIAAVGAGSPGSETTYFGLKTKQAVIKFQELYAAEILQPAGLSAGTGFVGAATRAKLNQLAAVNTTTEETPPPLSDTLSTQADDLGVSATSVQNLINNKEAFIGTLTDLGKQQGFDSETLGKIAGAVRATNDPDPVGEFYKQFEQDINTAQQKKLTASLPSPNSSVLAPFKSLVAFFKPQQAQALGYPFNAGGIVTFRWYCTCTLNWLLTVIGAKGGIFVYDVLKGTIPFKYYNGPVSHFIKGNYVPGGSPCITYIYPTCITFPSWGSFTLVGSI
jgi:peptidoglycan hydrolase-like protein with peptidoglycan-binding domain